MDRLQTAWQTYEDIATDLDGRPYDEDAQRRAQRRRNAAAWAAFEPVSQLAVRLVVSAENRLADLPSTLVQSRWVSQLGALTAAAHGLTVVRATWEEELDSLPPTARPGTPAYDTVTAERNASAWLLLEEWALHGQAVLDIRAAVPQRPRPTTVAPAAPTAITGSSSTPAARR
ncbi:hypothetical protein AB0G74_22130 [Streptomyces sp. NPDC020875]|uniref:hypothetical protein n=1 Tax=Streptomyces sp. NPDC020875 TaxID=3154898 RepID=UPI00340272B7